MKTQKTQREAVDLHRLVRLMMTLDPLVHDTFNSPLGNTGDVEGHSVIRTENGGYWYADDVSGDDHVAEAHAEIVRRVNVYPQLIAALQRVLNPCDTGPRMADIVQAALDAASEANVRVSDGANHE